MIALLIPFVVLLSVVRCTYRNEPWTEEIRVVYAIVSLYACQYARVPAHYMALFVGAYVDNLVGAWDKLKRFL